MNRIYRSIWNQATGAYAAVSENVKSAGKRSMPGSSGGGAHFALTSMAAALMLGYGSLALAGPTGGTVVAGQATINGAPGSTVIKQGSQNAVINWTQFNIGKGESVQFVQPNSNAVALNRVLGNDGTTILGNLSANGKVFIVNPNGILFGQGASVNTAGLVASTLDISNGDFMAGKYQFSGNGTGKVLNQGNINAPGGYVALLGANVSNEGTITARLGSVALAAGRAITLDVAGDGLLNVTVDRGAVGALVNNGGLIQADGGSVLLSAQAAGDLLKTVVNNTGIIEAHTIDTRSGTIKLLGDMQSGTVNAAGTLDASAPTGGNGGFIDTSAAHVKLDDALKVTTNAPHGLTGTWLIDPTDYTIAATGGDQTGAFYTDALKSNNVQIQSISGGTGTLGNINVNDTISWSANQLKMTAQNNININKPLRGSGTASLALEYGQQAVAAGNTATYNVKAEVDLPSGNNFSTRLGSDGATTAYSVINSLGAATSTSATELQGMKNTLSGNYVLGANIDASATSNTAVWGANGFTPVGTNGTPFTGQFDGLGHVVTGFASGTTSADASVGLFGTISSAAQVRNIGMLGVAITSNVASGLYGNVGALVGYNYGGTINNAYVGSGTLTSPGIVSLGGLVGKNSGAITNSYNNAALLVTTNSGSALGGLVGKAIAGSNISNSHNSGTVTANKAFAGGLVGSNLGSITNSFNTGAVTAGFGAGGITYSNGTASVTGFIANSYNTGAIVGIGQVGGVVGYNFLQGQVNNSYSTGSVMAGATTGSNLRYGGLVGDNRGTVANSYATGAVSGTGVVGGVVGGTPAGGTITNVYSSGVVSLVSGATGTTGGVVGNMGGTSSINGGYYNATLNPSPMAGIGNNTSTNATPVTAVSGLTATQMQTGSNFAAFNFTTTPGATGNNWVIVNTNGTLNNAGSVAGGTGPMLASEASSKIYSAHQLQLMAMNLAGNYTLAADVNAATTGLANDVWNGGTFIPVGAGTATPFTGSLDGASHTIYGLVINRPTINYAGLIGYATSTASVSNLGLDGGSVTGQNFVGPIMGRNGASISNSFSSMSVTTVSGSYSGGLVGYNSGTISNSYASGAVNGYDNVGALAGGNSATGVLTNNYSSSAITGVTNRGGLLGFNSGIVTNNFWDSSVNDPIHVDNGTSVTSAQMKTRSTFSAAGWDLTGTWISYDGISAPLLRSFMTPLLVTFASSPTKTYDGTSTWTAPAVTNSNAYAYATLSGSLNYGAAGTAVNAGTYAITAGGLYSGQHGYAIDSNAASLTINKLGVTLTGASVASRAYDGTTGASLLGGSLAGVLEQDAGSVAFTTGTFASKNAGTGIGVTALVTGSAGGNYSITATGLSGNITQKALTVSGVSVASKSYDGNTKATISGGTLNGLIGGESLTLSGQSGAFNDKDAGNGKAVTVTGATLSDGSGLASNYTVSNATGVTGNITRKALTVTGVTAAARTYDGTTGVVINGGALSGLVGTETLLLSGLSGSYADKNAGSSKIVTVTGAALGDAGSGVTAGLASNYMVTNPTGVTGMVSTASITSVSGLTAGNRVYDGTNIATLGGTAVINGMINGDNLVFSSANATFSDKNAGSGKTVNISGIMLGGSDLVNYNFTNTSAATTASISAKALTITGVTAGNKVYDGNLVATLAGGALNGLVGKETLSLGVLSGTFGDQNVGNSKAVTVTGVTLADAGSGSTAGRASNYTVSNPIGVTANITPKALTVTGVTAADKVYDGSATATLSGGALSGLVGTETLNMGTLAGAFGDKNAANGKAVTVSGAALGDAGTGATAGLASNYTVSNPAGVAANITQKVLTVSGMTAGDKVYDGNTKASLSGGTLAGLVGIETLNFSGQSGVFDDKNAASGKTVTVSGATLADAGSGASAGLASNYTVSNPTGLLASIAQKALTITGTKAANRVYDGSTAVTISGGALDSSGFVGTETVGLSSLSGVFADKNVGTAKAVTVSGAALNNGSNGGLASNYTVASPSGLVANVSKATISSVSNIVTDSKVYDGNTKATVSATTATFNGMASGDNLSFSASSALFSDKNVGSKTTTVSGVTLGGADATNYTLTTSSGTGTGSITPKAVTIINMTAVNKVYDGTTKASVSGGAISGTVGSETLGATGLVAVFDDKNAGTGKTVTSTGTTLVNGTGGGLASNYTVTNPTFTANITPKALTVSGMTAGSKVYDGLLAANLSGGALSGLVTGETLVLTGGTGVFGDKNVGTAKAVTVSGVSVANGTGLASNYSVTNPTTVTGSITPKAVTIINMTAVNKVYDGSTKASVTGGAISGTVGSETLGATGLVAVFDDKNAGIGKTVTSTGTALVNGTGGGLASNYTVTNPTFTANITPKALTVSGMTAGSKVYDGLLAASLSGGALSGLVTGETLVLTGGTGVFGDKNVGTAKAVTVSGVSVANGTGLASNYSVTNPTTVTGSITPKAVTIINMTAVNKVYDGSTKASVTGGAISGTVGSETLGATGLVAVFDDKNAGTGKTVTSTGTTLVNGTGGGLASNYTVTNPTFTANITPKALTVSGMTAGNKVYDGLLAASLSGGTLNGLVNGETLGMSGGMGVFGDKNVGNGKAVAVNGVSLGDGTGLASNYTVSNPSNLIASITPKALTVTGVTAGNKTYDGSRAAALSGGVLDGLVGTETLLLSGQSGVFNDKNAGTGKDVTVSGATLADAGSGATAGLARNYTVSNVTGLKADIAQKELTVGGITAANKVYDGKTGAVLDTSGATFAGMVADDSLTASASGAFGDKNAAAGKTVNIAGIALGGTDAANYTLASNTASTRADISKAQISAVAGITAANKVYDGKTGATLDTSAATFAGMVADDSLTASASGAFGDKNAAAGKTVNIEGIALGGVDAGNYILASNTASARADISKAQINAVGGITAGNKVYDGKTGATLDTSAATFAGMVADDSLTASASGAFGDKNAAAGKTINIAGIALGGTDAGNYILASNTASAKADISKAQITAVGGITAGNKVYDGKTGATLDTSGATFAGMVADDSLTASASGAFGDKNAATGKTVNIEGIALGGADVGNYMLASNTASAKADISKAQITAVGGITAGNKVYDGKTGAALDTSAATFAGMVADDSLTASAIGAFGDKNAAAGKTVNIEGIALGGTDAGNYMLASDTASAKADIAAKALTLSGQLAASKVYDGNANASLSGGVLNGLVAGETLAIGGQTALFNDKNAASGKAVTVTGTTLVDGTGLASNYSVSDPTGLTASITQKALTVAGQVAGNKVYDGNAVAQVSGGSLVGLVGDETLSMAGQTATFADKNAGNAKAVTVSGTVLVDGTGSASNYSVSDPTGLTASIAQKALTVAGQVAGNKVYDGNVVAQVSGGSLVGLVGSETLAIASQSAAFGDKNAGSAKTVTVSGTTLLDGSGSASNYTVSDPTGLTASITPATIRGVSGIVAAGKVYDGNNKASLNLAGATFDGMVVGDALALGNGTVSGAFSDKNAAAGKAVLVSGLGLGGQDAANYVLASNTATTTADINRASLLVSATAANRVYDATTGASVTLSDNRIGNDQLSIATSGASFSDKNAGTGKTVTVDGIAISGADAANYMVNGTASAKANIAQAALTVKVDNAEKDQGRVNPAFNASYAGLLGGDTVAGELNGNLAFATAATTGSVAGNYVVSASGQASGNYALSYVDGVLKVNPTAALQSTLANVIAAVNVAPSQGNMVQADLIASGETAPGKGAATPEAQREGEHDGTSTGASGAPVVQLAGNVVNNVLPGLRLSVVDSGLRLPTEAGGTHQESQ